MFLDQMKRGELQLAKEKEDQNSTPSCSRKVVTRSKSHEVVLDPQKKEKKLTCMIKCNDYFRDKVREKLHQSLSKVSREFDDEAVKECDPIRVAVAVESVLFENWGAIFGSYEIKYRSMLLLLDDPHPDFRRKVLLGEVSPEALLKMRTEEMLSDRMQLYNQQIKEENAIMEEKSRAKCKADLLRDTKDTYKCGRCGHTGTTYTSKDYKYGHVYAVDIVCLNCYQYWESTDIRHGMLSIDKNAQPNQIKSQPKRLKPIRTVRFGSVQYFD
ncbi:transcription elongation factor TFIIS-like [Melia azedarach]|uniref:Transcription elongation factor TFIIS-like n=1 Tax=Melia azedarach TaxID=155640 RepID=A0ACC1XUR0_MELAZ|nr:transcription elongation factor TFIIS-like [Melia azedarach]